MNFRRAAIRCIPFLLLILSATVRGEEASEVAFAGESRATANRLAEVGKLLDDRQWGAAIEQIQTILNNAENDLISINESHSVSALRLCQRLLATLPPEALALYRRRYEEQAVKKLKKARAERDTQQLRRIVAESFCTRAGEKAIDLLGDLAFERGRFDEAEEWWRLLSPLPDAQREAATRDSALIYPDVSLKPARIEAKQLLARLFQEASGGASAPRVAADLDSYRARHGKAEGTLAGRKGRYADLLRDLAHERKKEGIVEAADWPTFGGASSRGRVVAAPDDILDRLSALCREGPTWTFNLESRARQSEATAGGAVNAAQARSLAFYPIVVGQRVLAADAQYVIAYDLRTGVSDEWYNVFEHNNNGGIEPNLVLPAPADLRYTLTAAGDQVYARLGVQDVGVEAPRKQRRFGPPKPRRDKETFLACLGTRPKGKDKKHLQWCVSGFAQEKAVFQGAPLVAGGLIYIASTRYSNGRCRTAIECYPADGDGLPPLRWRREVCVTPAPKAGEPRFRHHLLTLAGAQIVYCTHTGAVVAVDSQTGRTNWALRYPRQEIAKDEMKLRDLAPVLFAAGRLYVAPADSDRLLCLDPDTGRTLWQRTNMKIVHLLGVGQGRLIFTTVDGLRAVGADDGDDASGWLLPHIGGGMTPAGRGLLIGNLVLWPTVRHDDFSLRTQVLAIRQRDGRRADDPALLHRLPAGNLIYANGCLIVADRQTLSVFAPPRMSLPQRKAAVQLAPTSPPALLTLARAQFDNGSTDDAFQTLDRAEASAKKSSTTHRKHWLHEIHLQQQDIFLHSARLGMKAKHWQNAATALRHAAEVSLLPRDRLHALLRAAQLWRNAGQSARAHAVTQKILADEQLRPIQVIDRDSKPMPTASAIRSPPSAAHKKDKTDSKKKKIESGLPLFRTWHIQLAKDEWVLCGWRESDSHLLLTGSPQRQFTCRDASSGEVRWRCSLPFVPSWAGSHADTILAGGELGIACLRRNDGKLLWHFPAPVSGRYPTSAVDDVRVIRDPRTPRPLTDFHLVSGRLFFLQGSRRLFALDAENGVVLWHHWAPDAGLHLSFPRGRFSPCYRAGKATVLMQSPRRCWLFDATTGRLIRQAPADRDLWRHPPLQVDERTIALAPDSRRVELIDASKGQTLWTHTLGGKTTLSGEAPQLLGGGDVLLCVEPANIGYFLQRLDRADGKPLWPNPPLLTAKTVNLASWTFDREAVYGVEATSLTARSLADGRLLWQRSLQGANAWQTRRIGDYLMVWPRASDADARFRFRSLLGTVQWNLGPLPTPEAVFAVECLDAKTGQLVQRLNFRMETPPRTVWKRRRTESGHYLTTARTSALLASVAGPIVRLDSTRPMIAAGGEVWGLKEEETTKHTAHTNKRQK